MRIDGHVTSVCLEGIYWDLLDRISIQQDMKLSQFISELYREALVKTGGVSNLSSVLRVACVNYLTHQAESANPKQDQPEAILPSAYSAPLKLQQPSQPARQGSA
jgi:predicted DNA-binding ribbon-helix-helix protein